MKPFALILALTLPAFVSADEPLGVIVSFRPGTAEAVLRKIDYAGLTLTEATDAWAICQAKPSRVQFAEQLRHEPEVAGVYVDLPCERFVVEWRSSGEIEALALLQESGAKVLYRGKTMPFAVCAGPLTAEMQRALASKWIEAVEPEAGNE